MAASAPSLICPQGHGPGTAGTRFCTWCGVQLVMPLAPGQPIPVSAASPSLPANPSVAPPYMPVASPVVQAPPPAFTNVPSAAPSPAAVPFPPQPAPIQRVCNLCGGSGARLNSSDVICPECGWLRPLLPGYQLDRSVFLWAQDGQAMMKLQKISALHAIVRSVSDKVGRPWIESTFNGIRLGPKQFPDVWRQAVLAARILGLPNMPDVYVSGEQMWNTYTFGTDTSSFIVLGTALLTNFQGDELLFILAREMGHCRAGHALWKTVTRFLAGDVGVHSGLLSNGVLHALSPTKLIEGAIDIPLMAWARQSEITADRAGLLALGEPEVARRVLLAWSIRSARLLKQVNIDEWMKQEDASDDNITRFSEMTTSSTMYTTRRLRLIGQSALEPGLMQWSRGVQPIRKALATPVQLPAAAAEKSASPPASRDALRIACPKCQTALRVPYAVLDGKSFLNVRCPQCKNVLTLRPKSAAPAPEPAAAQA